MIYYKIKKPSSKYKLWWSWIHDTPIRLRSKINVFILKLLRFLNILYVPILLLYLNIKNCICHQMLKYIFYSVDT